VAFPPNAMLTKFVIELSITGV